MSDTYSITLKKSFMIFFEKTKVIKNVKGHLFPTDIPNYIMLVILEDETKFFVNLNNYDNIEISKELFTITAKNIEQETAGQVKLEY